MTTIAPLLTVPPAVAAARQVEDYEQAFWPLFLLAFRAALRVLGDRHAAEDAAADAMTEAHLHWSRIRLLAHRDAWVTRVAINRALDVLRRGPSPMTVMTTTHFEERTALRMSLARELGVLSHRQREVVVLHFLVGLPVAEIAAALDIGTQTAQTHLKRAIKRLRVHLGEAVEEAQWS